MNEPHENNALSTELESLARSDRNEPDSGFEQRLADALGSHEQQHRHRRKKSTAWIPFITAAGVGAFAFFWWPTPPQPLTQKTQTIASTASEESITADIWLASLDTMDQLFAFDESLSDDLDLLNLQLDSAQSYFTSDIEWSDLGESL
ncbi:MAG: hypothetical protein COB69_01780 [Phycisphaera sp.]|nr:MAG: hypothetical protein COB69_01780 [Phycisphaera sp.]